MSKIVPIILIVSVYLFDIISFCKSHYALSKSKLILLNARIILGL